MYSAIPFNHPIFEHPVKNRAGEVSDYLTSEAGKSAPEVLSKILANVRITKLEPRLTKYGESMWISDLGFCKVSFDAKSEDTYRLIYGSEHIVCCDLSEVIYVILRKWY